jgi:predicted transcriptional regulator of viral defense system
MARTATQLTPHELLVHSRLTSRAAKQGGVVSALDARALGALDGDIRRLISAGLWTRPRRSVYADRNYRSTLPAPVHAEVCAATLAALDAGVVVSHLSAVHLLGLPTPRVAPEVVSVTRRPPSHGNDAAGTDIHVAEFDDADVVLLSGIPVLTGARLVVDCCQTMDPPDALAVADGVLRAGFATLDDLHRAVLDRSGIPFTRLASLVVSRSDPLSENWFESISRWWLLEA